MATAWYLPASDNFRIRHVLKYGQDRDQHFFTEQPIGSLCTLEQQNRAFRIQPALFKEQGAKMRQLHLLGMAHALIHTMEEARNASFTPNEL